MRGTTTHGGKLTQYTSYGVWGSGKVDPGNADALLRDFVSQDVGAVYRPERAPRGGLKTLVDWFEDDEILGPGGAVVSEDILASLLEDADMEDTKEVILIVLWPEEPTQADVDYVTTFIDEGIRVVNLSAALDDLIDPEVAEIHKPAPEKPARRSIRGDAARMSADGDPEGYGDPPAPKRTRRKLSDSADLKTVVEDEISKAAEVVKAVDERHETLAHAEEFTDTGKEVMPAPPYPALAIEDLIKAQTELLVGSIQALVRFQVRQILKDDYGIELPRVHVGTEPWIEAPEIAEAFVKDEAPFDGPYQDGISIKLWMTEDGTYRYRQGNRARRGEVEIEMPEGEVEKLKGTSVWKP